MTACADNRTNYVVQVQQTMDRLRATATELLQCHRRHFAILAKFVCYLSRPRNCSVFPVDQFQNAFPLSRVYYIIVQTSRWPAGSVETFGSSGVHSIPFDLLPSSGFFPSRNYLRSLRPGLLVSNVHIIILYS